MLDFLEGVRGAVLLAEDKAGHQSLPRSQPARGFQLQFSFAVSRSGSRNRSRSASTEASCAGAAVILRRIRGEWKGLAHAGIATKSCGGQRAIRASAPYQLQAPVCMSVFT
jgi:hypothetical protein